VTGGDPLGPAYNFNQNSLTDVLQARDLYHSHLLNKPDVIGRCHSRRARPVEGQPEINRMEVVAVKEDITSAGGRVCALTAAAAVQRSPLRITRARWRSDRPTLALRTLCWAAAVSVAVACGGGSGGENATVDPNSEGTRVQFDPANFIDPRTATNPFHPLKPGLQWTYGGTTEVGSRVVPHGVITTMTDVVRIIDGVPAIAMLDETTDSGELSQMGMDYLALDKDGNVWLLGGYTEDFEGGQYTNTEVAWLGTKDGQEVGVLSPRNVDMSTPRWFIGAAPEEAGTVGQPVEVGVRECVKFACYDNVRVVQEGEVGAPDNENKYYAPGVGVIRNVPLDASLHQDRFELLNFIELSPEGLAEASQTVLDLEKHAAETSPEVFGSAAPSRRK
jgi:hypothetical protein